MPTFTASTFGNHRLLGIGFALALLLLVTGCGEPTPTLPAPTAPPPSATPQALATTTVPYSTTRPADTLEPPATAMQTPSATPQPPLLNPTRILPIQTPTPIATATAETWPYFRNLVVSPIGERKLYAAIGDRAYSSDDGGLTWALLDTTAIGNDTRIFSVALDYRNPAVMYLTTSIGIYKSVDGARWTFVHPLLATALAVDLVEPDVLWAGVSWTTEYQAVVLKSSDAGRTWGKADFGIQAYLGYGITQIAIDPADPNVLYANLRYGGRFGWPNGWIYRGGRSGTWERLELPQAPTDIQFWEGACMGNGLAFDPNLRRVYVGCDAYYYNQNHLFLLMSDNAHEADSSRVRWEQATSFGTLQQPYALGGTRPLAVDARDPRSLYVLVSGSSSSGTQPYRILVSHDDAASWQDISMLPSEMEIAKQ
jgi:hypothetical protein